MKLNRCWWCLLVVAAISADDKKDGDKKFPTEHHRRLDMLGGEWDVDVNYRAGPDRFIDGKATAKGKWELGGNCMVSRYESKIDGKPFECVQVLGYDPGKKKYFECFFDNMYPAMKHNEGTLSADGKTLTLTGEHFDPRANALQKLRVVYTFIDADHFTLEWHTPKDGGGDERAVTLKHARKKSS